MIKRSSIIAAAAAVLFAAAGPAAAQDMPGKGTKITPVESNLLEEKFQALVLYRALEALGYEIERQPAEVEYQTAHLVLGTGDADFFAVHWDPLHQAFFNESGGDERLERVGTLISGALQGYIVDKASYDLGVTNLGDLKVPAVAERFDADGDGKADLAGCVPGWGCERVIEHQLEEFGLLDTINHNQGAYAAIIGDTIARSRQNKPIIYYAWTPYWVSGVLVPGRDVEWLEVPYSSLPDGREANTEFNGKNLGFEVNSIRVVANKEFLNANPAARKLLELAKIDLNDISAQNNKINEGETSRSDLDRHVEEWIRANEAEFESWLAAARKAG